MIKSIKEKKQGIEVDLTGPQGNAFYLLGLAKSLSKQLDFDYEPISIEMRSSGYENLINVFEKYFGAYVILYR